MSASERVILIHGVRHVSELAYTSFITEHLPRNEFFDPKLQAS